VVDDGSTDATPAAVEEFRDPRIRFVRHEKNRGIPYTRNQGVQLARGEYVAFLDSDDVARPRRLEKQVRFLDAHRDHALVGSWAWHIDAAGHRTRVLRRPLTAVRIRARLLFIGCFRTPSVMARREILRRYPFDPDFPVCSDSEVWTRMALEHNGANIPEPLIEYRLHSHGITKRNRHRVHHRKMAITARQLDLLGVRYDEEDLVRHLELRRPLLFAPSPDYLGWAREWMVQLLEANRRARVYPEPHFTHAVGERCYKLFWSARRRVPGSMKLLDHPRLRRPILESLVWRGAILLRHGHGMA
jgi:glycosyltransferase involved in cell wall biosynthesis